MDTRLVSLAVVLAAGSLCLAAAQDGRTVQDGVFSITQVERGGLAYETSCAACHGADLQGRDAGALVGEDFLRSWIGLPLEGLLEMLQSMPPEAASSLGDQAYLDILAYILHANGFPTGTQDLRSEVLAAVLLEGAEGPQEVPDHSLVRVVGCLTRGPRDAWIVTDSSEPDRTAATSVRLTASTRAASAAAAELLTATKKQTVVATKRTRLRLDAVMMSPTNMERSQAHRLEYFARPTRAVGEAVQVHADVIQQRQVQVGQRRSLVVLDMPPTLDLSGSAAGNSDRQVGVVVYIRVAHAAPQQIGRVVEQRAVSILCRPQPVE